MPKKYERIRDELKLRGYSDKEAKTSAAKIYNSQRGPGQEPVTRDYDAKMKKKK